MLWAQPIATSKLLEHAVCPHCQKQVCKHILHLPSQKGGLDGQKGWFFDWHWCYPNSSNDALPPVQTLTTLKVIIISEAHIPPSSVPFYDRNRVQTKCSEGLVRGVIEGDMVLWAMLLPTECSTMPCPSLLSFVSQQVGHQAQ